MTTGPTTWLLRLCVAATVAAWAFALWRPVTCPPTIIRKHVVHRVARSEQDQLHDEFVGTARVMRDWCHAVVAKKKTAKDSAKFWNGPWHAARTDVTIACDGWVAWAERTTTLEKAASGR